MSDQQKSTLLAQGYVDLGGGALYITPLQSPTTISGTNNSQLSGFSQVTLITGLTNDQILTNFHDNWSSSSLDTDHTEILNNMNNSQLTLVYSIVNSASEIDNLGDGWDPHSTGEDRLVQALEAVDGYDATSETPVNPTGEQLFYCKVFLDKYDDFSSGARGAYSSLFLRPKVDIKCDKFFNSTTADYTGQHYPVIQPKTPRA